MPSMVSSMGRMWTRLPYLTSGHWCTDTTSPSRTLRFLRTHLFMRILPGSQASSASTMHTVSLRRLPLSRTVSPRKSWSSSMVDRASATTELSSLLASSTRRRFGFCDERASTRAGVSEKQGRWGGGLGVRCWRWCGGARSDWQAWKAAQHAAVVCRLPPAAAPAGGESHPQTWRPGSCAARAGARRCATSATARGGRARSTTYLSTPFVAARAPIPGRALPHGTRAGAHHAFSRRGARIPSS